MSTGVRFRKVLVRPDIGGQRRVACWRKGIAVCSTSTSMSVQRPHCAQFVLIIPTGKHTVPDRVHPSSQPNQHSNNRQFSVLPQGRAWHLLPRVRVSCFSKTCVDTFKAANDGHPRRMQNLCICTLRTEILAQLGKRCSNHTRYPRCTGDGSFQRKAAVTGCGDKLN